MHTMIVVALLTLAPLIADGGGTARCTTREDPALQRWVTECTDGARAITRWDAGQQRYRTDITKAPQRQGKRYALTFRLDPERYGWLVAYGARFRPRKTGQEILIEAFDAYRAQAEAEQG